MVLTHLLQADIILLEAAALVQLELMDKAHLPLLALAELVNNMIFLVHKYIMLVAAVVVGMAQAAILKLLLVDKAVVVLDGISLAQFHQMAKELQTVAAVVVVMDFQAALLLAVDKVVLVSLLSNTKITS